jgi:hypothetical protein
MMKKCKIDEAYDSVSKRIGKSDDSWMRKEDGPSHPARVAGPDLDWFRVVFLGRGRGRLHGGFG